jgi:hypothetical protein
MNNPTLTIIARVNGFRKTTLALDYFKNSQATFINADLLLNPSHFLPLNALALILIFSRFFVSVLWQIFCLNAFNLFFFTVPCYPHCLRLYQR